MTDKEPTDRFNTNNTSIHSIVPGTNSSNHLKKGESFHKSNTNASDNDNGLELGDVTNSYSVVNEYMEGDHDGKNKDDLDSEVVQDINQQITKGIDDEEFVVQTDGNDDEHGVVLDAQISVMPNDFDVDQALNNNENGINHKITQGFIGGIE